jgi:hypothetical protein
LFHRTDFDTGNHLSNQFRVVIQRQSDLETLSGKTLIAQKRRPEVTDANQYDLPGMSQVKNFPQVLQQRDDIITAALLAKTAKIGQVFPYLRGGNAKLFRQFV